MIRKGYIQLTIQDWRNLPASYAGKLHVVLTEFDAIEKEKQEQELEKARRRY